MFSRKVLWLHIAALTTLIACVASGARADSVAQIATAVRINRATARLIDPQGRPGMMGSGSATAVRPGDILTFTATFTPVPNGGVRGLGGYLTVYVPRNTEVVGARVVDSAGRTLAPHRGGIAAEGTGPRGSRTMTAQTGVSPRTTMVMQGGSMSQLYADTGIFYSTDPRTARVPDGTLPAEVFIRLDNGILMSPQPTAYGQLDDRLGSTQPFAHNTWDVIQAYGFGVGGSALGTGGTGNTPDLYGSPVAGADSFYTLEATLASGFPLALANVIAAGDVGPWRRVQTFGAEIGRRGVVPPVPSPGLATRIGIPALDAMGRPIGLRIDADNPLPSFDASDPSAPHTRAVRFAVGELVVGEEYLCEFSLRVLDTPLDPISGTDTVCAEVFGGDASAENPDGSRDGKDNAWRYFLPAPACVSLGLLFDLDVSHLVILPGGTLTYTITVKNLSTAPHEDVVVTHCYDGNVNFVSASPGHTRGTRGLCAGNFVSWTIPRLDPGDEEVYRLEFTARTGETTGRAVFTSTQLPAPGFSTVAYTNIGQLVVLDFGMSASPALVETPPGTVRYTTTVSNAGTGPARAGCATCRTTITIPVGFTYVPGTAAVDGVAVADPIVTGNAIAFRAYADIAPGAARVFAFDANVPLGHPPGAYTSSVETWSNAGEIVSDSRAGLGEVVVGSRSETPMVDGPLGNGARMVCGTSSEPAGSVIRIYFGGVLAGEGTVGAGGRFCVTVPELYPGLMVSATAQASGEVESAPSEEMLVTTVSGAACSDGIDNDGDGFIDYPEDPECESAEDIDESRDPECADGIDNDGDGAIDFGADPGCSSLLDDSEDGPAACMNGIDDDGDGLIDFPEDPGCDSADDVSERVLPQCADGIDNDGDGAIDYPFDEGCESAIDDDERAGATGDGGVGPGADGGTGGDGGGMRRDAGGGFPDPGGVDRPTGGCGCGVAGRSETPPWALCVVLGGLVLCASRRRAPRRADQRTDRRRQELPRVRAGAGSRFSRKAAQESRKSGR